VALVIGVGAMTVRVQSEREAAGSTRALKEDPRPAMWSEVLGHIAQRPFTGFGFGRGLLRTSLQSEMPVDNFSHTHNLVLEAMLQTGLAGLLLLVVLLAATVREGWRFARGRQDAAIACGIALMGVVAGMLVRNMTDVLWVRQNSLLFWGVVGVLLAWGARFRDGAGEMA